MLKGRMHGLQISLRSFLLVFLFVLRAQIRDLQFERKPEMQFTIVIFEDLVPDGSHFIADTDT